MDSKASNSNIDNIEKRKIFFSTFNNSNEKAKRAPKPIIRNIKAIEPNDELLKRLFIKDENDSDYQANKDKMDFDFQIFGGEVEVNGVTFNMFIVVSTKDTLDLIRNPNMTEEEKKEYLQKNFMGAFEEYILKCLEDLSKIGRAHV